MTCQELRRSAAASCYFVLYIHGFMYVDTAIQFTVRDPVLQEFVKSKLLIGGHVLLEYGSYSS